MLHSSHRLRPWFISFRGLCTSAGATAVFVRRLSVLIATGEHHGRPGPQSFAPAIPGSIKIGPIYLHRNLQIERTLLSEVQLLYDRGDLRWFFTKAHGEITKLISENLWELQRPDAMLMLNIHFAEEFVRAL